MKTKISELEKLEELILNYRNESDKKKKYVAYLNLIEESLKLVKRIVMGMYPIPNTIAKDDLIQVGAVGVLKAIETYKDEIAKIIANNILEHFGFKKVKVEGYGVWKKDNYGWWYENKDGSYPVNQWLKLKDIWYYFDEKGYAYQNKWLKYKNEWYYFDNDCKMVTNKDFKIDGEGKMKI